MFCGKCGTKIKEGDSFCTNCGAKVDTENSKISDTAKIVEENQTLVDFREIVNKALKYRKEGELKGIAIAVRNWCISKDIIDEKIDIMNMKRILIELNLDEDEIKDILHGLREIDRKSEKGKAWNDLNMKIKELEKKNNELNNELPDGFYTYYSKSEQDNNYIYSDIKRNELKIQDIKNEMKKLEES